MVEDIESGKERNSNDLIEMISITPEHPLNLAKENGMRSD